jgi:hypothetical protein
MVAVVKSFSDGLGATMGGIAAVIGLGTMLGKLLDRSNAMRFGCSTSFDLRRRAASLAARRISRLWNSQRQRG